MGFVLFLFFIKFNNYQNAILTLTITSVQRKFCKCDK